MKITILGGFGFIGATLAERCIDMGYEVTVFSKADSDQVRLRHLAGRYSYIAGDFCKLDEVLPAIKRAHVVVHLVSGTVPGSSLDHPAYDVEVNVLPSLNLFHACVEHCVGKILFVSSGGTVYGLSDNRPSKESDCCRPLVPYAVSKVMIENYLAVFSRRHELNYNVLRFSNLYGPKQKYRSGQGVIAAWIERIRRGEKVEIWGDGNVVRDYIYIDDAVSAIILAMSEKVSMQTLNVGSGIGYSLSQLHKVMESSLGITIPIEFKPGRSADLPFNVLDITKIENVLGWSPLVSIEDGLRKTWVASSHA